MGSLRLNPVGSIMRNTEAEERLNGRAFAMEANDRGITAITFDFTDGECHARISRNEGEVSVPFGFGQWPDPTYCLVPFSPSSVNGTWREDGTLELVARHVHTPFTDTYECRLGEGGDNLVIEVTGNVSFGPIPRETLRGKAV